MDQKLAFEEIDIVKNPPTREELKQMYKTSGLELKKLFNTSGRKYRELGLKDKINDASEDELLDILSTDGMLMKRPLATDGSKTTVGFKEEEYARVWN